MLPLISVLLEKNNLKLGKESLEIETGFYVAYRLTKTIGYPMQPPTFVKLFNFSSVIQIKSPPSPSKTSSFQAFSGSAPGEGRSADELKQVTQLIKRTARLDAYGNEISVPKQID